jgi:hypothetical protein
MNTNNVTLPRATKENMKMYLLLRDKLKEAQNLCERGKMTWEEGKNVRKALDDYCRQYDWMDYPYEEDGKVGSKNMLGEIVIPPLFDDVECRLYYDDWSPLSFAKKNGKWGLVKRDGSGNVVLDFVYDRITTIKCFYLVTKDKKDGIVSSHGKVILPCIIDDWSEDFYGLQTFVANGKWGLIDDHGEVIEPIYDSIDPDTGVGAPCLFVLNGQMGWVDEDGKFTTDIKESNFSADMDESEFDL